MKIKFNSAEETRAIASEYFEKKKEKKLKLLLKAIKKDIACAAKLGKSETQVDIPTYLEDEVLNILVSYGYKVDQRYHWKVCYADIPSYIISWEDEGE
ncbi:hypothetical protein [Mammaliicoccus sp. E-M24]|uniref:hypothetical protein n=1 Tax=Mammaliicoccus sp. E-M24 TaxID=2898684 RepID=UPI001EFA84D7|nr:hypothetical protein [Mammaliicoccus sp. E-M24]